MKKKYLNLLTISCGILLMSVPAGYAAEGDDDDPFLGITGCPSGHYYQSTACHMEGGNPTPEAPEANCRCVIEGDEWGHYYCCDATNTGGGGGGGHGGGTPSGGITGGTSGGSSNSGCDSYTGTQKQCCRAGFTQNGTTPLYGCPSGEAFMGECPLNYLWWRCLDYADACEVMGYSTGVTSCPEGKQKMACPHNMNLTDKYYKCRDIPCYGKEPCGANATGCKGTERPCIKNGKIYCSPNNCEVSDDVGGGSGTCSTRTTDVGSRTDNNNELVSCSTEGMRSCDALGYLQNASDCPANGDRLTCPFDNNRFYCGGKIINDVTDGAKPCNVIPGVTVVLPNVAGSLTDVTNEENCEQYSNNIPMYNACVRRNCAKECYLEKTSEYCVTEYSTAVYRLQCNENRAVLDECRDNVQAGPDSGN